MAGNSTVAAPKAVRRVPRSLDEATEAVTAMRVLGQRRDAIVRSRDDDIAELERKIEARRARAERQLAPVEAKAIKIASRVRRFIEANRDELTRNGKYKSVKFALDDIARWVKSRYVNIPDMERFIDEALKNERYDLLRIEPNKQTIRDDATDISEFTTVSVDDRERLRFSLTGVTDRIGIVTTEEGAEWTFDPPSR